MAESVEEKTLNEPESFEVGSPEPEDPIVAAAHAGDAAGMVKAIFNSWVPQALAKHVRLFPTQMPLPDQSQQWVNIEDQELPADIVASIVAESVERLRKVVHGGNKLEKPLGYLYKIAENMVIDLYREKRLHDYWSPSEIEEYIFRKQDEENKQRESRTKVFAYVRRLLPQMGGEKVREVMAYHFDLLENGIIDRSSEEIGEALGQTAAEVRQNKRRGFQRLRRILDDKGITPEKLDWQLFEDEEEEQEENDGEEHS